MSIANTTRKAGPYTGNGVTVTFGFNFKVFQASDLLVVPADALGNQLNPFVLTTDYSVTLNANQDSSPGGSITLNVPLASLYTIVISSQVQALQSVVLTNLGGFYPQVVNDALDRLTILVQQLALSTAAALQLPITSNASGVLPSPAANNFLGWNSAANAIINYAGVASTAVSTFMATVVQSANAAAARLGLGAAASGNNSDINALTGLTGPVNFAMSTVASAASPDIWSGTGNLINFTGAVGVTGFANAPQPGATRKLICASTPTFTNGANMLIDGAANYLAAAGDEIEVEAVTVSQFRLRVKKADGTPLISSSKIQSIAASVASNALTLIYGGGTLDFRNATLTNGAPIANVPVAANSIVIPSGATLGTISATQARLVLLEAYNGGSPVLCVTNLAGSLNLDETTLISPTTISAGATANNIIYSASAVSANSPFRVVGFVGVTETTAGTWATAPTIVQGTGGQALAALSSLGYGQVWQASGKTSGVTYYNTMGKPMCILMKLDVSFTGSLVIGGVTVFSDSTNAQYRTSAFAIVPPGMSYVVTTNSTWTEFY